VFVSLAHAPRDEGCDRPHLRYARHPRIIDLKMERDKQTVLSIEQISERVRPIMAKHEVKEVYLFGSYARGEANRDSDVDLYCDKGDVETLWQFSAFCDELESALGKKVDVITIGSQVNDFFRSQLEKDMIRIN